MVGPVIKVPSEGGADHVSTGHEQGQIVIFIQTEISCAYVVKKAEKTVHNPSYGLSTGCDILSVVVELLTLPLTGVTSELTN